MNIILFILILLSYISLLIHALSTLFYPLAWDQAVFAYIGKRIVEGEVLYKDLFDHKGPAVYYTNALIGKYFGLKDYNIMFFNLFMGILGSILTYKISKNFLKNKFLIHIAVILFVLFYFSGGYIGDLNQFENYISVFLILLIYLAFNYKTIFHPIIFGLILSYITLIKPQIYWMFSLPFIYFILNRSNSKFLDISLFLISFSIPIIGFLIYFYLNEAIYPLYWCLVKFNTIYVTYSYKLNRTLIASIFLLFILYILEIKTIEKTILFITTLILILIILLKFAFDITNLKILPIIRNILLLLYTFLLLLPIIKKPETLIYKLIFFVFLISFGLVFVQKSYNYHYNTMFGIFPLLLVSVSNNSKSKIPFLFLFIFIIFFAQKRQNLIYYSYKNIGFLFKDSYKLEIYKISKFKPMKNLYQNYHYLIQVFRSYGCYGKSGVIGKHLVDHTLAYWSDGKFINDFSLLVNKLNDKKAINFYNYKMKEELNKNYKCLFVNINFMDWVISNYRANFYSNYKLIKQIGNYKIFVKKF